MQGNATRRGTPCWTWNGDVEKPTLKPSIRTKGRCHDEKTDAYVDCLCHSFVTAGQVKFLCDCTHEFAGQTVDLLEVDCNE